MGCGESTLQENRGFSLVEALIAMAITLVVLGVAMGAFNSLSSANSSATQAQEVEQNLQAGLYLMKRDLANAGSSFIPRNGIGVAAVTRRPGIIGGGVGAFGDNCITAINPGVRGTSDMVNILLPRELEGGRRIEEVTVNFRADAGAGAAGATMAEVDVPDLLTRSGFANLAAAGVRAGDLIYFRGPAPPAAPGAPGGAAINALRYVTGVSGNNILLRRVDDPSGLNQDPFLVNVAGAPAPVATLLRMVTYFRDDATSQLMRQVGYDPAIPIMDGAEKLELTYDTTQAPTDQANGCATTELNMNSASAVVTTRQQRLDIRKVNVNLFCRSENAASLPPEKVLHTGRAAQVYIANLNICNPFAEEI